MNGILHGFFNEIAWMILKIIGREIDFYWKIIDFPYFFQPNSCRKKMKDR